MPKRSRKTIGPQPQSTPKAESKAAVGSSPAHAFPLAIPTAVSPVQGTVPPGAPEEPVFDVNEIQGNSLVGFNKDYQTFLFLKITEPAMAKQWLRSVTPHVATVAEVLAFRRLFRAMRARRLAEAPGMIATWINIAFTWEGIKALTSQSEADKFTSDAFKLGMHARAPLLGDPSDAQGNPTGWVVGDQQRYPDILLIVASDSQAALHAEMQRIKDEIRTLQGASLEHANRRGLSLIFEQEGADLPGDLAGHEHFGFKDGVSQPGIRGRVSSAPLDFLTPRLIDPTDPLAPTHARPGQPLVWPGQFVLGDQYPLQNEFDRVQPKGNISPEPAWARNGSFLVFRRLNQDVTAFWEFVHNEAARLAQTPAFAGMTPERFASLLVGRWPSGAPIMRAPLADDPLLAAHGTAINHFNFNEATPPVNLVTSAQFSPDHFPPAPEDHTGQRCPFAGHIRKVNPRDDPTELGGSAKTLLKSIVRRGIPFGKPLVNPLRPRKRPGERGLLFVAYQSSIESQFEFLTTDWANSIRNPRAYPGPGGDLPDGDQSAEHDPIIGQQANGNRERSFVLQVQPQKWEAMTLPKDWVIPTGGGYFFSPSITALREVLSA